ncbi:MAG: hypothetical protein EA365_16450 [Gloeocapsa sp. DLM2.Bin57]|nr:MAG: hypothetical protein EA365_16450 [Gloeocapsa sp. DLM2.Bin57]
MTLTIYSQKLFNASLDKKQGGLLVELQKSEFSGSMLLQAPKSQQWQFVFYLGRIIYATGGNHAIRRYQRNLGTHIRQPHK